MLNCLKDTHSPLTNINSAIKELHSEAARLLKEKADDEAVISHLIQRGIDRHYAETVLENVKNDQSDRSAFYKHLLMGSFVLAGGIILTLGTRQMTAPGGMYLVFYGFMIYGVVTIARAFILFRK